MTHIQTLPETKCISCSKAASNLCRWIGVSDMTGLVMRTAKRSSSKSYINENGIAYSVVACPKYKKGELPPVAWNGRCMGNNHKVFGSAAKVIV